MGASKPVQARKCALEAAKSSLGSSERPQIEPDRACWAKKRSMGARSTAIFFKAGANEASRSEKVRYGGAVRALMSEDSGPPSSNLDRDGGASPSV